MKLGVVGVGLLGGSLALAWRRRGVVESVVGIARRAETLAEAQALGVIDQGSLSLEALRECDLVLVATPVRAAVALAPELARVLAGRTGTLVTDVGSTKAQVVQAYEAALRPGLVFVGGHPMAGSERGGVGRADAHLFEGATYVLTPRPDTPAWARERMNELALATGAQLLTMTPEEHDRAVASVSHLPQLTAVALAAAAGQRNEAEPLAWRLAAGGFRDTTRIASSPVEMWLDIFATNPVEVRASLTVLAAWLDQLTKAIADQDEAALRRIFAAAHAARAQLPPRTKGRSSQYYYVLVYLTDRPGALGDLGRTLGDHNINVEDIELLRKREGEGGNMRLGFASPRVRREALRALERGGFTVRLEEA